MKKIFYIIILLLSTSLIPNYFESDFCNGWNNGYHFGYCNGDPYCLSPIPPLCPVPNLGESTYEHGFSRGKDKGEKDKPE